MAKTRAELLEWLEVNLNRSARLQVSHAHLAWYPTEDDKETYQQIVEILKGEDSEDDEK